jgi:hypothetical protein
MAAAHAAAVICRLSGAHFWGAYWYLGREPQEMGHKKK